MTDFLSLILLRYCSCMKTGLIECNICLVYILELLYVYIAGFVLGYCLLIKLRELSFCDIREV